MPSKSDQKLIISGGELQIGSDVKVPYKLIRDKFPQYAEALKDTDFSKKIRFLKYVPGDSDNRVEFTDHTVIELSEEIPLFDRICSDRYVILTEYNTQVVEAAASPVEYKITVGQVLSSPIQTRDALMKEFFIERGGYFETTTEQWINLTKRICKDRLYASDWTQLLDVQEGFTDEEKTFWKDYRAQLRACMDSLDPYAEVVIPVPPKGSTIESN